MSASNFDACFKETESFEGGFVDNPHDPGGATMGGVTQATYSAWRAAHHLVSQSVRGSIVEERRDIYRTLFWNSVRGDDLPAGVDLAVVDCAWGSGPQEAVKMLQRVVGVEPDGRLGSDTLQAVLAARPYKNLVASYCAARLDFYKSLSTWKFFGTGWGRRISAVLSRAQAMTTSTETIISQGSVLASAPAPAAATFPTVHPDAVAEIVQVLEKWFGGTSRA